MFLPSAIVLMCLLPVVLGTVQILQNTDISCCNIGAHSSSSIEGCISICKATQGESNFDDSGLFCNFYISSTLMGPPHPTSRSLFSPLTYKFHRPFANTSACTGQHIKTTLHHISLFQHHTFFLPSFLPLHESQGAQRCRGTVQTRSTTTTSAT